MRGASSGRRDRVEPALLLQPEEVGIERAPDVLLLVRPV